MKGRTGVRVVIASQPNSHPHLGTITTAMSAFAVAKHLSAAFAVGGSVLFDALENSPGQKIEVGGKTYQRSLNDTLIDGESASEVYLKSFRKLLSRVSELSEVAYSERSYRQFCSDPVFRRLLIKIVEQREEFVTIVSPSTLKLHIRFPCPVCQYTLKHGEELKVEVLDEGVRLKSTCFEHGVVEVVVKPDNDTLVDVNTPIRHILRGALVAEENRSALLYSVMIHGSDWAGVWQQQVHFAGLSFLGYSYRDMPKRIFAPLILDWSGAKFSKSLYVQGGVYDYLPPGLTDLSSFMSLYGDEGLRRLWTEVEDWVSEPKKFFRNYSIEYLKRVLGI